MPAITDAYATPLDYRTIAGKSDGGDDDAIKLDLLAVSRWLDQKLGRFFTQDAAPVARTFAPPSSLRLLGQLPIGWAESENPYRWGPWARHLSVDDMAAPPTKIVIDDNVDGVFNETPLNSTLVTPPYGFQDYECWPTTAQLGPEPQPYTTIVLPMWSSRIGFLAGQRVQITAQWGWPAIPAAITRATCHLTAILRLESPRATSRVTEMNQVISTSKQAQSIVYDLECVYRRKESVI